MIQITACSRGDRLAERGERVLAPHARQQEHRGVRVGLGPRAFLEGLRARVAPPGRRRRRALALAARERAQLEEALRARRRLAHDLVVLEALRLLCGPAARRPSFLIAILDKNFEADEFCRVAWNAFRSRLHASRDIGTSYAKMQAACPCGTC